MLPGFVPPSGRSLSTKLQCFSLVAFHLLILTLDLLLFLFLFLQLLLGYLPPDRSLWPSEMAKKRSQYKQFKDELLMNPVCCIGELTTFLLFLSSNFYVKQQAGFIGWKIRSYWVRV